MSNPLPSLEPRRLLRDRAANALLWSAGTVVCLFCGLPMSLLVVVVLMAVGAGR